MADTDSKGPPPNTSREDRLKQALRANLRRRKAQAKERFAEPIDEKVPPDDAEQAD